MDARPRRLTPALAVSIAVHVIATAGLVYLFDSSTRTREAVVVTLARSPRMIWIPDPRPAARGGGGRPQLARPLAPEKPSAPALQPIPVIVEPPMLAPETVSQPIAETVPVISDAAVDAGAPRAGAGDGEMPGGGPGRDSGPGSGGEVYGIGNGVSAPIPLRRPQPAYTADAMRARLQGVVVLNCVVRPDGRCSDIRVMQSLDSVFGLDDQAVASAREWRFRPGQRLGSPVPVLVTLEIAFNIR
jgi:periplasmic protein TonB